MKFTNFLLLVGILLVVLFILFPVFIWAMRVVIMVLLLATAVVLLFKWQFKKKKDGAGTD